MTTRDRNARPGDARRAASARPGSTARPSGGSGRPTGASPGGGRPAPPSGRYRWFGLAVAVIAVVVTIVLVMTNRAGGDGTGEKTAPPEPTATSLGPPRDCGAGDLAVTIGSARPSYVVGSTVDFSVTLARTGSRPCLVDGSMAGTRVVVTSGKDTVWSSADCFSGEEMFLMGAGDKITPTVRWKGQRSAQGCPRSLPAVEAGTYQAVVSVPGAGNLTSEPIAITLTPKTPPAGPSPTGTGTAPAASAPPTASPKTTTAPKAAATPAG